MPLFLAALSILAVPISVTILSQFYRVHKLSKFHGCQDPPRECSYDFLGVLKIITSTRHLLNKTALSSTIDLFHKYGETYTSTILAHRIVFTCDPRNIKHVLVTRFVDFDSSTVRVHLFLPITERGIFTVDGPKWKVARDLYRNVFSRTRSILDLNVQEQHIQSFIRRVPSNGEPFDLQALFLNLTFDLTTAFALGESVDSLSLTQSDEKRHFVESLRYITKIMARDGFLGPVRLLLSRRKFYRGCADVHRYVERVIENVLEKKRLQGEDGDQEKQPKGYVLLQALADNTDEVLELRDGVISVLIAGIDSVASLLSTTFWLLARNERVFQKLRASILDNVGQELPTYDQLKSLTYLRHVLNEGQALPITRLPPPILTPRLLNSHASLSARPLQRQNNEQRHYVTIRWRPRWHL